jgi:choline-sulfatase
LRILYFDIDTLRPDHLGCYGYHRDTSPHIDVLAERGVRFTDVYASDVPCLPSRTALISGMFGIRNGVANHGGVAADLRAWGSDREFLSPLGLQSYAGALMGVGYHTASFSSFPLRHSAPWWTSGFLESMNLVRGFGGERADEMLPGVLDWLERRGRLDSWFLHVHLWDPHTPYNVPVDYGNPFAHDPIPGWHTEAVRRRNWELPGPHSAQEPWGFRPDEWGPPPPRQPWNLSSEAEVRELFDGYDVGVRYADDAVGIVCSYLDDLGVLDETAIWVGSDHGEALGELGVYSDHQAADEVTAHIPAVLVWPGLPAATIEGLQYHLDIAATVADLAGVLPPRHWDGVSRRCELEVGDEVSAREYLVLSQGAWTCQRGVRFGSHLYLRTLHDGFHADWSDEMLFDVAADPHEQTDLAGSGGPVLEEGRSILSEWTATQLDRALEPKRDPLEIVIEEGGPYHVRGRLPDYLRRLEDTGRAHWIEPLLARHGTNS